MSYTPPTAHPWHEPGWVPAGYASWGRLSGPTPPAANLPGRPWYPLTLPVSDVFIHHAGGRLYPDISSACRDLDRFALNPQANPAGVSSGIEYNFVVHPDGTAAVGRGAGWKGAATYQRNSSSLSIVAVGCYSSRYAPVGVTPTNPTAELWRALRRLLGYLVVTGAVRPGARILPHSAVRPTICPGELLAGALALELGTTVPDVLPPPALPDTSRWTVLRRGATGTAVRALQLALNDTRTASWALQLALNDTRTASWRLVTDGIVWRLVTDGIFGPVTEALVRQFQQRQAITVDGIVGPVTWRTLYAVLGDAGSLAAQRDLLAALAGAGGTLGTVAP